jgi:hypothetical protein
MIVRIKDDHIIDYQNMVTYYRTAITHQCLMNLFVCLFYYDYYYHLLSGDRLLIQNFIRSIEIYIYILSIKGV